MHLSFQALRRVRVRDPVLLLDEVDKMGADSARGDPSSALLEVLDPAQNAAFVDTYLGVPFDLSRVTFVATANRMADIPAPLLDRMEVRGWVGGWGGLVGGGRGMKLQCSIVLTRLVVLHCSG